MAVSYCLLMTEPTICLIEYWYNSLYYVHIYTAWSAGLLKPNEAPNLVAPFLYNSLIGVKSAKVADVSRLYKYLSDSAVTYLRSIPDAGDVKCAEDDYDYAEQ